MLILLEIPNIYATLDFILEKRKHTELHLNIQSAPVRTV